jgi:hypothetical protein
LLGLLHDLGIVIRFPGDTEVLNPRWVTRGVYRYIEEYRYWKNGVILHNTENRAKIKADLVDRKIFISILGKEETRRAFLAVIRMILDEINSNFKIEIKRWIPVPGFPRVLVSYEDLLVHEEMKEPQIVIPELRRKLSVSELLDGVDTYRRRRNETQTKQPVRILRIVVASPSDVQSERNVLPSVIEEVNLGVAADRGLHLVLSRWEIDTHPGFHTEGPQGLIDPILKITDCDLLIGIFWKRFGTPTPDGKTGTEHEFGLAYEAWKEKGGPQIFIYFNQQPYTPNLRSETAQWGQVLEFKDKFPNEGLWWPYTGKAQFERQVRKHLTNYIRELADS